MKKFITRALFLLLVGLIFCAYWWSGDLLLIFLKGSQTEEQRAGIVKFGVHFPLLRKEGLVEAAVSRYHKSGEYEMKQILLTRYSEDVLLDALESLWRSRLAAKEYFRAGKILAFAHQISAEKFRARVSQVQVAEMVEGMGSSLREYLARFWYFALIQRKVIPDDTSPSSELSQTTGLADLRAYPLH